MRKVAILLIACLILSAFAGCARANESGEEMATLNQPEQIIQKEEGAEQKEPADINLDEEPEEEGKVSEQPQIQEQPKEDPGEKETDTPQTTEKNEVVRENVPNGAQYELSTLPRKADQAVGLVDFRGDPPDFKEIQAMLDPDKSIVFRGKVNGKSTQYFKDIFTLPHNETPVLVQEVYYGKAEVGDTILCMENMFVQLQNGEPTLEYYGMFPPLEKNEEYLFIVHNIGPKHEGGEDVYYTRELRVRYIPIGELKTLQGKKELNIREQRELDALTYYYLGQRGEEK